MTTLDPTAERPAPGPRRARDARRARLSTAAQQILLGVVPALLLVALVVFSVGRNDYAVDFHYTYWPAGWNLLHGISPYQATATQIHGGWTFVYPALAAFVFAPFALLSHAAADMTFMLLCIACVPAALYVMNVRDWRVYGAALMWLPVFGAWQSSNLTSPLLLLIALTWRYRDERPALAGVIAAVGVSLKPFVWPLVLWLLLTRRWRAAAWSLAAGLVINLAVWSVVGFGAIGRYLHLSSAVTAALWRQGYSVMAVAGRFGLSQSGGEAVLVTLSLVLLAVAAGVAWRSRRAAADPAATPAIHSIPATDVRTLVLATALMLVASPLLWTHYFALLLVPLAVAIPRFAPIWLAPLLMICPERTGVLGWELALAWIVTALCLYWPYRAAD